MFYKPEDNKVDDIDRFIGVVGGFWLHMSNYYITSEPILFTVPLFGLLSQKHKEFDKKRVNGKIKGHMEEVRRDSIFETCVIV